MDNESLNAIDKSADTHPELFAGTPTFEAYATGSNSATKSDIQNYLAVVLY